jgi:hypothetical protein
MFFLFLPNGLYCLNRWLTRILLLGLAEGAGDLLDCAEKQIRSCSLLSYRMTYNQYND